MLIPMILSGGAGTRLWPVSRESHPKPFMRLADGHSLLGLTYRRALGCDEVAEVITITNRDYYFQTRDVWSELGNTASRAARYLLEPVGRNTAPAILAGALDVQARHGDDAILLVLPADHLIRDTQAFAGDVGQAAALALDGRLVTFGIRPTRPETGFGYIRAGDTLSGSSGRAVLGFVEKPDVDAARGMIDDGGYYWNSGMFCFTAGALVRAFADLAPEMLAAAGRCREATIDEPGQRFVELDRDGFAAMENISIDYAIMEKADNVAVVPATFDWSDIGSWTALAELTEADSDGNCVQGDTVLVGSRGCFVQSEERTVAAVGVEDLVVIDTADALLVAHRDRVQEVKEVVSRLKQSGHEAYKLHRTVFRPWGSYTVLENGSRYKIKRIEVKPGESLSLQMHHHRSEHWIVVSGMARVVNGEDEFFVRPNESTYIPAGHKHRLENPGVVNLVMIEVQSGEYLGEDDIVRFSDVYGRA
ncbi:MAG: mannose-1-phosphate guanylyltransferase/mannose-6-phosphate isomerase [Zoogloeaceae bacterium]|nr:mannose-1-phosphate guanylyltransferase/mannose-6-phosphate isomerase [Rhodocyclaceae bacterium]MCP5237248.1 mannose-1-phosphate guanylyltransferase/mannose-6-phosphate isomerase [Zoogloeaceae bacterium]